MATEKVNKKTTKKVTEKKTIDISNNFSIPVYLLTGEKEGTLEIPSSLFGEKPNKTLLSQAIRVYQNNQKTHSTNTKTRSEVRGSTRKIFKQKGTGRARHGAVRAPIFVGGGIALGPKFRKVILDLPKKMKRAALISALSEKYQSGTVYGISGLDKLKGKTSEMKKLSEKVSNALIVLSGDDKKIKQAVGNLESFSAINVDRMNTLDVIKSNSLIFTKEALESLENRLNKKDIKEENKKEENK